MTQTLSHSKEQQSAHSAPITVTVPRIPARLSSVSHRLRPRHPFRVYPSERGKESKTAKILPLPISSPTVSTSSPFFAVSSSAQSCLDTCHPIPFAVILATAPSPHRPRPVLPILTPAAPRPLRKPPSPPDHAAPEPQTRRKQVPLCARRPLSRAPSPPQSAKRSTCSHSPPLSRLPVPPRHRVPGWLTVDPQTMPTRPCFPSDTAAPRRSGARASREVTAASQVDKRRCCVVVVAVVVVAVRSPGVQVTPFFVQRHPDSFEAAIRNDSTARFSRLWFRFNTKQP